MTDLLPSLRSLRDAVPRDSAERDTLTRAVAELEHLRRQRDELQARGTELVEENRRLKAPLAGRPIVRIKRIGSHNLPMPAYATDGAAGMDLRADAHAVLGVLVTGGAMRLYPGKRVRVPCGFAFEIPPGYLGDVRGRSGWTERGVYVAHGLIDPDYTGPVCVHIENRSGEEVEIAHGDRIAQLVICKAPRVHLEEVEELSATTRGTAGFGSTGIR